MAKNDKKVVNEVKEVIEVKTGEEAKLILGSKTIQLFVDTCKAAKTKEDVAAIFGKKFSKNDSYYKTMIANVDVSLQDYAKELAATYLANKRPHTNKAAAAPKENIIDTIKQLVKNKINGLDDATKQAINEAFNAAFVLLSDAEKEIALINELAEIDAEKAKLDAKLAADKAKLDAKAALLKKLAKK